MSSPLIPLPEGEAFLYSFGSGKLDNPTNGKIPFSSGISNFPLWEGDKGGG
jgi:hypothetical protein